MSLSSFEDDATPWEPFFVKACNRPASLLGYVYPSNRAFSTFRLHAQLALVRS